MAASAKHRCSFHQEAPQPRIAYSAFTPSAHPPTVSRVAAYATHHAYAQEDVGEDDASPAHRHAAPALFPVTDCPHFLYNYLLP